MGKYIVSIDREETSDLADVVSITGRVNGTQCAVKLRLSALTKVKSKDRKLAKQKSLVEAYENKAQEMSANEGEEVEL